MRLIICGAAPCIKADLEQVTGPADYMAVAVTPALEWLPEVNYLVTCEPKVDLHRAAQLRGRVDYVTYSTEPGADVALPDLMGPTCFYTCRGEFGPKDPRNHHHFSGGSTMMAVKVALRLGYRDITIAGSPLDTDHYIHFQQGWLFQADFLRALGVRSLSGWTKELLDMDTPRGEWA
jgi:hypothetical protein